MSEATPSAESPARRWQPLSAIDRRVVGVLAEKAKTTPDVYPMSLNAVCTACNQKSNRHPLMQLEPEQVEESLERLRKAGAVGLIEGTSRVEKFRHYLYEWLGVDKFELAVITELLLRGAQTVGDLRARAARMEPIPDQGALRPILHSLLTKELLVELTPEGRGQIVSHNLYLPRELERVRSEHAGGAALAAAGDPQEAALSSSRSAAPSAPSAVAAATAAASAPSHAAASSTPALSSIAETERKEVEALRRTVAELRAEVTQLAAAQEDARNDIETLRQELRNLRDALGG